MQTLRDLWTKLSTSRVWRAVALILTTLVAIGAAVAAWTYGARKPLLTVLGARVRAQEAGARYSATVELAADIKARKATNTAEVASELAKAGRAREKRIRIEERLAKTSADLARIGDDDEARARAFNVRHARADSKG